MAEKTAENKNPFSNLSKLRNEASSLSSFADQVRSMKKDLIQMYNKSYNASQNFKKQQKAAEEKAIKEMEAKIKAEEAKKDAEKLEEKTVEQVVVQKTNFQPHQNGAISGEKRVYYPKNNFEPRSNGPRSQNGFNRGGQQGFNRYQNQNGNPNFKPGANGVRPNGFNRGGTQGFNAGRPNFNGRPGMNNVARPFNQKPGFARKPSLEPLPDYIKQNANRNEKKKKEFDNNGEKKTLSIKQKMRFGIIQDDFANDERMGSRKLKTKKEKVETKVAELITKAVITSDNITVKDLSETISRPVSEIIKQLMLLGQMKTINSTLDFDTAELVAGELGVTIEKKVEKTFEEKLKDLRKQSDGKAEKRPPIVTVMGHVDHGKTSLLDAIRKTNVIEGEAGGITQRIGAYSINYNGEKITFIDTPGHAAFSKMRARGAQITDVAILVVAANDGIMPQTIESIKQIQLAGVPMIVAINKIDLQDADPDRVKQQLTQHNVIPEEWGGDTICVPISAKKGIGIDKLIEMILLVSEVAELKADKSKDGEGVVLEAQKDKNRGSVANIVVQDGTIEVGDTIIAGTAFGKVRAMFDENGKSLKKAGPSTPVSILGLDDVPSAGDYFYAVDEKLSKQVIEERKNKIKLDRIKKASTSLDDFYARVDDSKLKHFNIIIKADVQGSAEALEASLIAVSNEEVRVNVISASAGAVTETDVEMAESSSAIIIAFNIKTEGKIDTLAKQRKVEILTYKVIYTAIDEIEKRVKALKEPVYTEKYLGRAEIRMVFKLSSGVVAGSYVLDGKIERNAKARILRDGKEVASGSIETLKIQKDDKKEVNAGYECGIKVSGFSEYKEKDIIECFMLEEVKE